MFTTRRILTLGLLLGGAISCKSDSTGPSAASITGIWQATKVEYVSTTGLGSFDVVDHGGSATLMLNTDKTFSYLCTLGTDTVENLTGTWDVTDVLTLNMGPNNQMQFDASLARDTLTLTGADREYDLNDDGMREPAKLNLTLTR